MSLFRNNAFVSPLSSQPSSPSFSPATLLPSSCPSYSLLFPSLAIAHLFSFPCFFFFLLLFPAVLTFPTFLLLCLFSLFFFPLVLFPSSFCFSLPLFAPLTSSQDFHVPPFSSFWCFFSPFPCFFPLLLLFHSFISFSGSFFPHCHYF